MEFTKGIHYQILCHFEFLFMYRFIEEKKMDHCQEQTCQRKRQQHSLFSESKHFCLSAVFLSVLLTLSKHQGTGCHSSNSFTFQMRLLFILLIFFLLQIKRILLKSGFHNHSHVEQSALAFLLEVFGHKLFV